MSKTIVDSLYEDFSNILAFLEEKGEVSWANAANDNNLNSAIQDFMEIGRERNRLIHEDFGNFSLEKTSKEIHDLYIGAIRFVEWFPEALKTFAEEKSSS